MVNEIKQSDFLCFGKTMIGRLTLTHRPSLSRFELEREFRSLYGVGPDVCCTLWSTCGYNKKTKPKHLLWGLMFLKTYETENILAKIAGTNRKTFRKWNWYVIQKVANRKRHVVGSKSKNVPSTFCSPLPLTMIFFFL
jgi:hypothetical protein